LSLEKPKLLEEEKKSRLLRALAAAFRTANAEEGANWQAATGASLRRVVTYLSQAHFARSGALLERHGAA